MRYVLALIVGVSVAVAAHAQSADAEDAFPGLTFQAPVALVAAPGQPDRAYVVEQTGRVRTARLGDSAASVFLDLSGDVRTDGELGLLGLAFHPDYEANGYLFVNYTAPVETPVDRVRVAVTRLSRFTRSEADPLTVDRSSERVLLEVDQPFTNHNAGTLAFGTDGLLYAALGDGGGGGDPLGNGQDPTTLLGAVLRIDVDDAPAGAAYGIPPDNPFAGATDGRREEIYAYGFRNPWKFSIDPATGDLWLGDVGQSAWEEIDRVEAGGNYGWNRVEGPVCYQAGCDLGAYEPPVFSYTHGPLTGRSITGGFVYRGTALPELAGHYLYSDFVSGRLWALDVSEGEPTSTLLLSSYGTAGTQNVSSVDPGPDGEAYVVGYSSGRVFRLVPMPTASGAGPETTRSTLALAGANPFRDETAVEVAATAVAVSVRVYDVLGREVARLYDGPVPPGPFRLRVDGARLAPGVYTVRLVDGAGGADVQIIRVP